MNIKKHIENIKSEERRNEEFLHLTANENQLSETARIFLNSPISDRYYMGAGNSEEIVDFGAFVALGFPSVEALITEAEDAAKEMLGATSVNLNVLSGVHAMMCAILSTTEPGDLVMTVRVPDGGHFATEGILERVGRKHAFLDFDRSNLRFDVEKIAQNYKEQNAKAIYLDVSYYLNPHNLTELREAVGKDAIIIYDASHTMGLIMGQTFQAPLKEGANVVCANTHKTLPGPHKGMIAFRDEELGKKANDIIDGSLYSTPHMTHLIALSITILEMKEFGEEYAKQTVKNSRAMGKKFEELGYEVRKANNNEFSNNHQVHPFIDDKGDRLELYKRLLDNNISTNFDTPMSDRLFIRVGTQELTRRGMEEADVEKLAELIHDALTGKNVKEQISGMITQFSNIKYSFDEQLGL